MKFYQVHLYDSKDSSNGFRYYTTKNEALECKREWEEDVGESIPDVEFTGILRVFDIEPNKRGILDALEELASHPRPDPIPIPYNG